MLPGAKEERLFGDVMLDPIAVDEVEGAGLKGPVLELELMGRLRDSCELEREVSCWPSSANARAFPTAIE